MRKRKVRRSTRMVTDVKGPFSHKRISPNQIRDLEMGGAIVHVFGVSAPPAPERRKQWPPLDRNALEFIQTLERDSVLVFGGSGSEAVARAYCSKGFKNVYTVEVGG